MYADVVTLLIASTIFLALLLAVVTWLAVYRPIRRPRAFVALVSLTLALAAVTVWAGLRI